VETKYLLRTADELPAFIAVETSGWRTGPREVMERLQDPERADGVDPSEYSFKLSIKLETGDERYRDRLNGGLWIGSGARTGDEGTLNVWSERVCLLTLCSDLRHLPGGLNYVQGNDEPLRIPGSGTHSACRSTRHISLAQDSHKW
jgi:hypothetical protein